MSHEQIIPGAETLKQQITPEQIKANIEKSTTEAFSFIKEISAESDNPAETEQTLLEAFNAKATADLDFKKYYGIIDAICHL